MQQVISMPISFISLVLATVDIFYTLRLGSFSDPAPTFKMVLFVAPFTALLTMGPLSSLILVATYFHGHVFIYTFAIISINATVMKYFYFSNKSSLEQIKNLYNHDKRQIFTDHIVFKKHANLVFSIAIFTSWISPCAVWFNNFEMKSYFLVALSTISMLSHCLGISSIYLFIHNCGLLDISSPPIFHCFTNLTNPLHSLGQYHATITSDTLIEICQDNCQRQLRLCSENEDPGYFFFTQVGPLSYFFIICSLMSAIVLQFLGNFYTMYNWSKFPFCNHPIVHISMIKDILKNSKSLMSNQRNELLSHLERGLGQEEKVFILEATNHFTQKDHLLNLALWNDFPEVTENVIKINLKFNQQESIKRTIVHKLKKEIELKQLRFRSNFKLEEILNVLESHEWTSKQIALKVWHEQPLFNYINNCQFGLVCLLHFLGGTCRVNNEHDLSALENLCQKLGCQTAEYLHYHRHLILYMAKHFTDSEGNNILHVAIKTKNRIFLRNLLKIGVDLKFRTKYHGRTPLHSACASGSLEIVKLLLDRGANIHEKEADGGTALHIAAAEGNLKITEMLLLSVKCTSIHEKNMYGRTPLHWAARSGHSGVAQLLLDRGAIIDEKEVEGFTALHLAAANGHFEFAELMIANGANCHEKEVNGWTPLHWAARFGHFKFAQLLIENGANIQEEEFDGWTPLHLAAAKGHLDIAQLLIDKGGNIDAKNGNARTPLNWAARLRHLEIGQQILDKGGTNIHEVMVEGWTPLHLAAAFGQLVIAKLLVEKGANLTEKNVYGSIPCQLAARNGHLELAQLLKPNVQSPKKRI